MNETTLHRRLARLERTVRLQRRLGALALLLLAGWLASGATPGVADTLRVKRLEITDDLGNAMITLDVGAFGGVLELNSREAVPQVKLMAFEPGGMIAVMNRVGQLTSEISHVEGEDGQGGSFRLLSASGHTVVAAGASRAQDGLLRINRADGAALVYAGANRAGNGMLRISNRAGQPATVLVNRVATGGHIEVFSADGAPAGYLRSDEQGMGELRAWSGRR